MTLPSLDPYLGYTFTMGPWQKSSDRPCYFAIIEARSPASTHRFAAWVLLDNSGVAYHSATGTLEDHVAIHVDLAMKALRAQMFARLASELAWL